MKMGKFDGILICTDLDGTLYKKDKTISDENREAIEYFKREGGYFTFITGRLPYYSVDAYNRARPNAPFGCINGGGVYDGEEKRYIWTREIAREVIDLVKFVDERFCGVGIQICCLERTYFLGDDEINERFRKRTGITNNTCNLREISEPMGKIIFNSRDIDKLAEIEKLLKAHPLGDRFDYVRAEKTLFEILPKGVNKGLALEKLVEYLDLDADKTVAIGDFDNDVGMLKAAKLGVAVSNASKLALEAADIVTVSNEEHAIARVIYALESGEYHF
jgi:Cof subfamily protein (haloacid dehalogenase superfamily)